jgi:4-hydroxythreonine-4-phosphate dehydrogenase
MNQNASQKALPRIAVTMGDPAGVGPEICLRLLANAAMREVCVPIIFGDASIMKRVAAACDLPAPEKIISAAEWQGAWADIDAPVVYDIPTEGMDEVEAGVVSAVTGRAGFVYVEESIRAALAGEIDAVSTAPLNKEALNDAGVSFPGHTEIFASQTKAERACMMLTSDELTCAFVTVHVGYHEVPGLLNQERILDTIELAAAAMKRLRGRDPKLIACGLNPHAGEGGLFGNREEENIIAPALEVARERGIQIEGPLPPDTCFLPWRREATDCFICMYHDQGHIPLKALAFDKAINVTLGLPIVRTSVDHGTACDIAWQGKANPSSLYEAVGLAAKLAS